MCIYMPSEGSQVKHAFRIKSLENDVLFKIFLTPHLYLASQRHNRYHISKYLFDVIDKLFVLFYVNILGMKTARLGKPVSETQQFYTDSLMCFWCGNLYIKPGACIKDGVCPQRGLLSITTRLYLSALCVRCPQTALWALWTF